MKTSVVIVAAGRGERFGGDIPKSFVDLNGKPMLAYSIEVFESMKEVSEIIIVTRPELIGSFWEKTFHKFDFKKIRHIIPGGATREDSVWEGLQRVSENQEVVLVHDAARPMIQFNLIEKIIAASFEWGSAIPALKVKPTLKEVDAEGFIVKTQDREHLWEAQTPQGFRVEVIRNAFEKAGRDRIKATDDAFLVEQAGGRVKIVDGDPENIKITTQEDLKWASLVLTGRKP